MKKGQQLDQEFQQLVRRTKLKKMCMTVVTTVITIMILLIAFYVVSQKVLHKIYWKTDAEVQMYETVASPNIISNSRYITENGLFGGVIVSHRYKNIAGYRYPWSAAKQGFGLLPTLYQQDNQQDNVVNGYHQVTNTKVPVFFDDKGEEKPTNELTELSKMKDHVGEIALTFDRAYTYREIQRMIPNQLLINWYWTGASAAYPTGINTYDNEVSQASYESFKEKLHVMQQNQSITYDGIDVFGDAYKTVEKIPNITDAPFKGVILSGKTEDFAQLLDQSWIVSSAVGVTMPRLPYIKTFNE